VLDEGKGTWFPAELTWMGDTLYAELRLKGGLTDHLRTRKWSYRIQLAEGDTVYGMGSFSIHHPNTRNFCYEWIFHRALRDQGLPWLKYDFIDVKINASDLGLYAIEQHFDSTLLARLGRVGPVVKFDDEQRIGTLKEMNERPFNSDAPMQGDWQSAPIEAFHTKAIWKIPLRRRASKRPCAPWKTSASVAPPRHRSSTHRCSHGFSRSAICSAASTATTGATCASSRQRGHPVAADRFRCERR
jgi:hypothetical protein